MVLEHAADFGGGSAREATNGLGRPGRSCAAWPSERELRMSKFRVLVIDDDDVARSLVCSVLEAAGHETFELPSPIGATRLIQEKRVDAVVIDVVMPALSGDRLATLLRGNPRFKNLGVVLVSGNSGVQLEDMAQKVKADAVVTKVEIRAKIAGAVALAIRVRRPAPVRPGGA